MRNTVKRAIVASVILCAALGLFFAARIYIPQGNDEKERMTAMDMNDKHRQIMEKFKTMINTNDKALAEELIDSHAAFRSLISHEPLYGGSGYLSVVEFMRKSFSDIHWEIEDMAADGDKVAVNWTCSGTHDGTFMGMHATGKKFSFSCMNFYYFNKDDKIINDVAAQGMLGLFEALGIVKAPN